MESKVVSGVAFSREEAKITLFTIEDRPGVASAIFGPLADAGVNVDMIVQNASHAGGNPATDLTFTVDKPDLNKASKVLESLRTELGFREVSTDESIGKVSIVGVGMRSHTGIAHRMFSALAEAGINIEMISTSEIKVSVVIDAEKADQAVRLLHDAFALSRDPASAGEEHPV